MANLTHSKARYLLLEAGSTSLPAEEQAALDAHLAHCPACQAYSSQLEGIQAQLRGGLRRRWDPVRTQVSLSKIRAGTHRSSMFKKTALSLGTLAVIAALAFIVFGLLNKLPPPETSAGQTSATPTPAATGRPTSQATPTASPATPPGLPTPVRLSKGLPGPGEAVSLGVNWSPDGKYIIFGNDADMLLYSVRRDGSGLTKLSDIPALTVWGWAADGSVVFLCAGQPGSQPNRIISVAADGSNATELTNPKLSAALQGSCDAMFSPDRSKLAFTRDYAKQEGLFVMDASGENLRQISPHNLHGIRISSWSKDGNNVYFSALDSATGDPQANLYVARLDNNGKQIEPRIVSDSEQHALFPELQLPETLAELLGPKFSAAGFDRVLQSPDGTQIAFTTGRPYSISDIFVVNTNGSNLRRYPNPGGYAHLLAWDWLESWSPDGQSLVFRSEPRIGTTPMYLYLIDVKDIPPYQAPQAITGAGACGQAPGKQNAVASDLLYTTKSEDTLAKLAATFHVPGQSIIALNNLDENGNFFAGWELHIRLAARNKNDLLSSGSIHWPVQEHSLNGRDYSYDHSGLDLAGAAGEGVQAAGNGTVVFAGPADGRLGNVVVLDHGAGIETIYAHLDQVSVACGDTPASGASLGTVGQAALYFEIRYNGEPQNPWNFLPAQ